MIKLLLPYGMDERLTAVETKLSYLEDMVMTLNALVAEQQREIDALQVHKDRLENRLAELAELSSDLPNRRPPHY
jgi:SlyX protein